MHKPEHNTSECCTQITQTYPGAKLYAFVVIDQGNTNKHAGAMAKRQYATPNWVIIWQGGQCATETGMEVCGSMYRYQQCCWRPVKAGT
jgi:hypothetical protein